MKNNIIDYENSWKRKNEEREYFNSEFLNKINIKKYKDEIEKFDALAIKNRAKYKISKKTIDEIKDYCFLYLPMLTGMEKEAVGELLNEKYNIDEMEIDIPNKLFFEDEEVKNEQKHWFQMYKMLFGKTEIEEFKKEDLIPIAEDDEYMLFIERRTGEVYINIYELFFFCAISDSFDEFLDACAVVLGTAILAPTALIGGACIVDPGKCP